MNTKTLHVEQSNGSTVSEKVTCRIRHFPSKRIFDILFSLFILITGAPLYLLIALSIVCTSKGGIIYAQERVGRGGRFFRCYKFRTMYKNAEQKLEQLIASDPKLKQEWESTQKLKNDPRITPIGLFLRKTSLDELPQFWNALIGDLSVVGPRPVLGEEVYKHMGSKALKILSVRPGITGLWQVTGRSNTSYKHRVRLDEIYIDQRSFIFDLWLIIKTIPAIISCRGAY